MPDVFTWLAGFGLLAAGCGCIWLALTVFEQYRRALTANPDSPWLWAALRGAPLVVVTLLTGAMLGGSGLLLLAYLALGLR